MSNSENQTVSDTGSGILVGVDPAQPRSASDWNTQQRADQAVSQPTQHQAPPPQQPQPRFSEEDIERARQQEKDKLYPRLEEMNNQLRQLQEERQTELAERQRLAEEADQARQAKEESEMEVRQLLEKREQEMKSELNALAARYDNDRAVYEKERQLQEAELYRRDRIAQEAEHIIPALRDYIRGSTIEEIDAAIEDAKARSEDIFTNFVAANEQQPYQQRGASLTAPPVGPMEQLPAYEQLTPEAIRDMDMDTYKRYRQQLLPATNPNRQRGR